MNIEFSTILDLKVNKENVKMIENKIEKINNDIFGISFKDCANGHTGNIKEIIGKSLYIETWCSGERNGDIGIRLKFGFYYSKDDKKDIENVENILIYVNSLSDKNRKNDLKAFIRPSFFRMEEKYFTLIEKCSITHDFIGINQHEIKDFLEHITNVEESEKIITYK